MKRRRRKEISLNKIIILFVVCTLTFSVGYSLLSQQLSVEGTAHLVMDNSDNLCNEYATDDLKVEFDNKMLWHDSGYNYMQLNIKYTNISQDTINDWKIIIDFSNNLNISGSWSGNYELFDKKITITGLDWNRSLAPGAQIELGFQIKTTATKINLDSIYLNGDLAKPGKSCENPGGENTGGENTGGENPGGENTGGENTGGENTVGENTGGENTGGENTGGENTGGENTGGENTGGENTGDNKTKLDVKVTSPSHWVSGENYIFQYDIIVTNNSDINLDTWSFQFEIPEGASFENYWQCNYVNADGLVTITPVDNNSKLDSGNSTQIGIQLKVPSEDYVLSIR